MQYGLSQRHMDTIRRIFSNYPEIHHVSIFGSRALGTFRSGSDIDLAILDENIPTNTIRSITVEFEESSLPYRVDVLHFPSLQHQGLREHINSIGKSFPVT